MKINIYVAGEEHKKYAEEIVNLMFISAQERGTGIAKRSPEYVMEKMTDHKSVIALAEDGTFAGFSYIETWSHTKFVANSGLIVAHQFRKTGLAKRIKRKIFELSRTMYPYAKIFSITTGLAVMKINTEMGYHPVPFSELTDDQEFWAGCKGCRNYDILQRNNLKMCLCTALLYDPSREKENNAKGKDAGHQVLSTVAKGVKFPIKAIGKTIRHLKIV